MDKEEVLINTQTALFFDGYLEKPEDYYADLNSILGNIFDNTPLVLPVPKDQRLNEVAVVSMTSSNGVYTCNIARTRIDVFIAGEGKEGFTENKKKAIAEISEKVYSHLQDKKVNIKRLGFITRFFIANDSQEKVIEQLLNKEFITIHEKDTSENVSEFIEAYIKYVRKIKFLNMFINNYTTVEKFIANISGVGEDIKGVLITRDFNTNPEVNFDKGKDNNFTITSFINESTLRFSFDEIKKLLWPE